MNKINKIHLALIGSSIVCLVGLMENSTAIVIGSMAIAPIVGMVLNTLKSNKPVFTKWAKLLLWILVPIFIGCIGQIARTKLYDKYVLGEKNSEKRTDELLKRTGQWTDILITSAIVGVVCGFLLRIFPKDHVIIAGIAIALSLIPPLVASGMFAGFYLVDRKPETPTNIRNALFLFATNVTSLVIGYKFASYFNI